MFWQGKSLINDEQEFHKLSRHIVEKIEKTIYIKSWTRIDCKTLRNILKNIFVFTNCTGYSDKARGKCKRDPSINELKFL